MKRTIMLLLAALLLLLTGCSRPAPRTHMPEPEQELIVVGFSQVGAESDWRNANTRSMQEAFSAENGYRLIFDDAQQKQQRQITAIRNFINQGVDYIVLAPTTEKGWETVLGEARQAGIPVIIVDRMIEVEDTDLFTCWVGSDFRHEGDVAVQWLEEHCANQPLQIVHLQGNLGSTAQIGRTESLDIGLSRHPEWQLVFRGAGDFTQAKGQELVRTILKDHGEFNVIYSENDNMIYGAVDAIRESSCSPSDYILISFDASSTALQMILNGELDLDVECNPMHGPRVRSIIEQLRMGATPPKFTYVDETYFEKATLTEQTVSEREY